MSHEQQNSSAENRALAWASLILDEALEYPRAGEGWPHYSADEETADAIIRAAGLEWMLPGELREQPMDRAVHHFRALQTKDDARHIWAASAARDTQRRERVQAINAARASDRQAKAAARYPVTVTGTVVYLGAGQYGIRCERSIRASREIPLPLKAADKGRTVTVRVHQFTEELL